MRSATRIFVVMFALAWTTFAFAQTHVRGYYRKNGTYVAPHYRSSPNHTRSDNWNTRGNVNPYTGEPGTRSSYPTTTYSRPEYDPRTYAPPSYRPQTYYPRTYAYPSTSSTAPQAKRYTLPAPAAVPKVLEVRWYRCDDSDGSYHYSHQPGPVCSFVGSTR